MFKGWFAGQVTFSRMSAMGSPQAMATEWKNRSAPTIGCPDGGPAIVDDVADTDIVDIHIGRQPAVEQALLGILFAPEHIETGRRQTVDDHAVADDVQPVHRNLRRRRVEFEIYGGAAFEPCAVDDLVGIVVERLDAAGPLPDLIFRDKIGDAALDLAVEARVRLGKLDPVDPGAGAALVNFGVGHGRRAENRKGNQDEKPRDRRRCHRKHPPS